MNIENENHGHDLKFVSQKMTIQMKYVCDTCHKIITYNLECPNVDTNYITNGIKLGNEKCPHKKK